MGSRSTSSWAEYRRKKKLWDKQKLQHHQTSAIVNARREASTLREIQTNARYGTGINPTTAGGQGSTPGYDPVADPTGSATLKQNVDGSINAALAQIYTPEQLEEKNLVDSISNPVATNDQINAITQLHKGSEEYKKPNGIMELLNDIITNYMRLNHNATRPLTALALATNPDYYGNHDTGAHPDDNPLNVLSSAWDDASATDFESGQPKGAGADGEAISYGQSFVSNPLGGTALGIAASALNPVVNLATITPSGDPTDPEFQKGIAEAREEAPEIFGMHLTPYDIASGFVDTGQQGVIEPFTATVAALKMTRLATKLSAKGGRSILNPIQGLSHEQAVQQVRTALEAGDAGTPNSMTVFRDEMVKNTDVDVTLKRLKASGLDEMEDAAHALTMTNDPEMMNRLILAGIGDRKAIQELQSVDPAYYFEIINRNAAKRKEYADFAADLQGIEPDDLDYATWIEKDSTVRYGWEKAVADDPKLVHGIVQSMVDRNPAMAKDFQLASEPQLKVINTMAMTDNLASKSSKLEKQRWKRAQKGADNVYSPNNPFALQSGTGRSSTYRESRYGMAVSLVRWPLGQKPEGMFGLIGGKKDGNALELQGMFRQSRSLSSSRHLDWKKEQTAKLAGAAYDDAATAKAVTEIEKSFHERMAWEYAETAAKQYFAGSFKRPRPEARNQFKKEWVADKIRGLEEVKIKQEKAQRSFEQTGYDVQTGSDPHVVASPQLQQHLQGSHLTLPVNILEREFASAAKDPHAVWSDSVGAGKNVQKRVDPVTKLAAKYAPERMDADGLPTGLDENGAFLPNGRNGGTKEGGTEPNFDPSRITQANQVFQSVWRPTVLLRAAYPARNTIEGYARVLGWVGLREAWKVSAETIWNATSNTGRRLNTLTGSKGRAKRKLKRLTSSSTVAERKRALFDDTQELVNEQIDELNKSADPWGTTDYDSLTEHMRNDNIAETGDAAVKDWMSSLSFSLSDHIESVDALKRVKLEVDEARAGKKSSTQADKDFQIKYLKAVNKVNKTTRNKHIASGEIDYGDGFKMPDALNGKAGNAAMANASSGDTWSYMASMVGEQRVKNMRRKILITNGTVYPDSARYPEVMNSYINDILKDSVVTQMRLDNASGDDFVRWLFSNEKSAKRELSAQQSFGMDTDDIPGIKTWFESGKDTLFDQFPDARFRSMIREGKVTLGDVHANINRQTAKGLKPDGNSRLPILIGDKIFNQNKAKTPNMGWWRALTNKGFHYAGSVPENTIVRLPYYTIRYRESMDAAVNSIGRKALMEDDELAARIVSSAHRYALKRVRKDIYTIRRQKNLVSLVENVSPFWTAQLNTVAAWPRIWTSNPRAAGGTARLFVHMREAGMIDEDGYFHPVPGLQLPWGSDSAEEKIPFANVLSVFTGHTPETLEKSAAWAPLVGAVVPGVGPQMQWFASEAQRGTPVFKQLASLIPSEYRDGIFDYINPYGPSTEFASYDKFVPSYVRTFKENLEGSSNSAFAARASARLETEVAKYQQGLRDDMPTPEEIESKTHAAHWFHILGVWGAPGSPRMSSALQPLVDIQRGLIEKHGYAEGGIIFDRMFGEKFSAIADVSPTASQYGLGQSKNDLKLLLENEDLVREIAELGDPKMVSILLGKDYDAEETGDAKFNSATRKIMMSTKVAGSDTPILKTLDPYEMQKSLSIKKGNQEYRERYTAWRLGYVEDLTRQYGSEDKIPTAAWKKVSKKKERVVDSIAQGNDAWKAQHDAGGERAQAAYLALKRVISDEKFMKDKGGDRYWVTVRTYVAAREQMSRDMKGGAPDRAQTPDEYFAYKKALNKASGYEPTAERAEEHYKETMKEYRKKGSDKWKEWQYAKYNTAVEKLKKDVRFGTMYDRWFMSEQWDAEKFR